MTDNITPEQVEDQFYFDVYCANDGMTTDIKFPGGKIVTMTLKSSITLHERKLLSDKAIKAKINIKSGKVNLGDVDQEAFVKAVLEFGVIAWPFKNRDGSPVPITPETLAKLPASAADQIVSFIMDVNDEQLEANDPFETPSVEA